jgi:hypothetical protein
LGVVLCAALLGPLAVTLSPSLVASNAYGASGGSQTFTQAADQLSVKLTIDPGRFGTNQVTIVATNPDQRLASNGTVLITTTMVEMDMGNQYLHLDTSASQQAGGLH